MQSAAGACIAALKAHYPHVSRKLFLAPVFQRLELVGRGMKNIRGKVFVYGIVGFPFHHFQIFLTQLAVEVDRYALAAHMEPHVVITEMPVYQAGNDMLSRVLLHEPAASFHIDPAGGLRPRLKGRITVMHDLPVFLVYVQHPRPVYEAVVGGLSASLRIEAGPVQSYFIYIPVFHAARNNGVKLRHSYIAVVKSFAHDFPSFVQK